MSCELVEDGAIVWDMSEHPIEKLLQERIVILDGAMGTNIQTYKLTEEAYRGERFADHPSDLKGNNDLLCITRPQVVEAVHTAFLEAGADIIETNTFNATPLSQADYGLEPLAYELNVAAAGCARRSADRVANATGQRRFVAGAIGPLSKTLSISRDVNDPGARDVTFDQVRDAYDEQLRGLIEGGVDLILVETIFDTLNAKAALFAIEDYFDVHPGDAPSDHGERHHHRPQRPDADRADGRGVLYQHVSRAALEHRAQLRAGTQGNAPLHRRTQPHRADLRIMLSERRACLIRCRRRAFPKRRKRLRRKSGNGRRQGWLNIVGGCCGTTPAHIKAIAEAVRDCAPRVVPQIERRLRLSGLEVLAV